MKKQILFFFLFFADTLTCQEARFLLGVYAVDITPPVGYKHYKGGNSTGVGSPLFAKAIVFEQNSNIGALLICDLQSIQFNLSRIVREKVSALTSISFSNISICATHTHTGPDYNIGKYAESFYKENPCKSDSLSYESFLVEMMVDALVGAYNNRKLAEVAYGIQELHDVSFNRRFLMTDGSVRSNPGRKNKNIVRPVGTTDADVQFLLFANPDSNKYFSSLSVFACHTDTKGGTEYHGDFPFYLEKKLKEHFGNNFTSIFGLGTCGDINTTNVQEPKSSRGNVSFSLGHSIATKVIQGSSVCKPFKPNFIVVSKVVNLPLQSISAQELQWARGESSLSPYDENDYLTERQRKRILSINRIQNHEAISPNDGSIIWYYPYEMHLFQIDSDNVIVTLPGELFVELGIAIKEKSPYKNTMILTLANTSLTYIPTSKAFSEGGYEIANSRLAKGSGEEIVKQVTEVLNRFYNENQ